MGVSVTAYNGDIISVKFDETQIDIKDIEAVTGLKFKEVNYFNYTLINATIHRLISNYNYHIGGGIFFCFCVFLNGLHEATCNGA